MTPGPQRDQPQSASDPLLHPFLFAASAEESDRQLRHLLEKEAAPVMRRVLERKARATAQHQNLAPSDAASELEDVYSSVREELIRQLTLLRSGERTEPVLNFRAYTGAVAYAIWAESLRRAYPARSILSDRLRYLFEGRTNRRDLALWSGAAGERWCGFARWQGMSPGESSPRLQLLLVDPVAAARAALGPADVNSLPLARLVAELFGWLDQPMQLRDLVELLAELLQITDSREPLEPAGPGATMLPNEFVDPGPSPVDALKWEEYLRWLWRETALLSHPQRSAFLLHSGVLREFELSGIGSLRQIAALLELPAEKLAAWWEEIPLGDLAIGAHLGRARQQVINLRRLARDRLAAAWKEWIK